MSKLEELGLLPVIKNKIENGATHQNISDYIMGLYPTMKGASVRSIRRFCEKYGLHYSSRLTNQHLDILVSWSVGKVLLHDLSSLSL